jgi:glycine betaine catabolism B
MIKSLGIGNASSGSKRIADGEDGRETMVVRHNLALEDLYPLWDCDEDDRLICRAIYPETQDIKTFLFTPAVPRQFSFAPGQFLTFEFPIGGESVNRSYTIASSPTRPFSVAITVKRSPGGLVSNWLHDHLKVGDVVRAVGPLGEFSTWAHPADKRLFLSGGVGATPMMSYVRRDFDMGEDFDTLYVHFARTPKDIVFRQELEMMAFRRMNLKIAHVAERTDDERFWSGLRGRFSPHLFATVASDFLEREIFCCGPAPFMAAVRSHLEASGFDMQRYHEESFDFDALSPAEQEAAPPPPDTTIRTYEITFAKSGRTIPCDENTSILAAARLAGMRLPASCAKGLCGTCKSRKQKGEVQMNHAGGIRQREIEAGMILLCCSSPRSDIVVDR